jgi:hypothetical protein
MSYNCQTHDQTISQAGWSDQDADSGLAYASLTQAVYTVQTPLLPGNDYFWKTYAIDPMGTNTWSTTHAAPFSFTTIPAPSNPAACTSAKTNDNASITLNWVDNSTTEDGYQIWKVTDGGTLVHITPDLAANVLTYTDTSVTNGHSYGYMIRSFQYDGSNTIYSDWCPTATTNTSLGSFLIN